MSLAYRTGTIAVPNGGTTVTGTLTAWINQVKQGDLILLPDGILYEVAADPTVNTSLTIVEPYAGTTVASGGAYAIYRFSDGWRPTAEINIRLGTLLDRFEATTGFILNGTGVPSDALGEDGDLFIRTDVPSLYSKSSGTWSFAASLGGDAGPAGPSYAGTSTTSRTLGTGSMTVTTQTGLAYVAGTRVRLSSAASPTTHYMEGVVTAYDTGTGSLTFTADLFAGSGARADWNLSLAGDRGTQGATGAGYSATSTTSLLIGTGTKAFVTQTGLGYTAGQRARASSAADTANFMEGRVTSYSGGTLTLTVDVIGGSGTFADWNINLTGAQGLQGPTGATGSTGPTGPAGASYAATSATSLTIGLGSKSATTQTGLAYVAGSRVRMASAANTSNYMEGICTAYNSGTGAITIDAETIGGSGTFADWNFSLAGNKGDAGVSHVYVDGGYNAATTYSQGQWIKEGSASWVYINTTPAAGNALPTLPTTSNTHWALLAEDGADGSGAVNSVNGLTGDVTLTAADLGVTSGNATPKFHTFGGQLRDLHKSLITETEQLTVINFVGDSITWGSSLPNNAISTPRDGTMSDPRDNFESSSFVNEFKRYIGAQHFEDSTPTLSNWLDSSSGQSTAEYSKTIFLDPLNAPCATTLTGTSITASSVVTSAAQLGYRYIITDANLAGTSRADITFPFTGTTFAVIFTSIAAASSMYYRILVNGVDVGVDYDTWTGVVANKQRRVHTISYVRGATITIRSKRKDATGPDTLTLEAIEIEKKCRIVNQGIIGADCRQYLANNFGAFDTDSLTADVNYTILMMGTNDRGSNFPTYSQYNGVSNFRKNLNLLIDELETRSAVILMTPPPATDNSAPTYAFSTGKARDVINGVGATRANDVIDNYAIFRSLALSEYLADGLHPNATGHVMIAANMIGALEAS